MCSLIISRFLRNERLFNVSSNSPIKQLICSYSIKNNNSNGHDSAESDKDTKNTLQTQTKTLQKSLKMLDKFKKTISDKINTLQEIINAEDEIPKEVDVIIIGGGAIGSSIAFWLKNELLDNINVAVVEKDPTYCQSSTALSVGGIRQQFSMKENIEMSLFGAEFLRTINDYLSIPEEPPIEVNFHPNGYLMLATESDAKELIENSKLQNFLGACNKILTATELKERFPWLNTENIEVGCLGLQKEGWFDPWSLLCALKKKAAYLGVQYINAKVVDFGFHNVRTQMSNSQPYLNELIIETPDGKNERVRFAIVVLAAGASSGDIAKIAGIGIGSGPLSVPLPVEPRKRYVYGFHCPEGPTINVPLTVDPSGLYFRRDGLLNHYICGRPPKDKEEPPTNNLDVDHDFFENNIWPLLGHRVKAFENLKVKTSWAGYYEYNTFDRNGIIGRHPYYCNMFIATGFSGHGIQQSPAVGRAIAELIIHHKFCTIDLTKLGFERFFVRKSETERNII